MFSAPSGMELAVIFIVILLLFGKKIPELAKGLGSGIKNFKNTLKEGAEEETAKAENIQNPINNEVKISNEKIS
ncbi:MAG: twin-arginine translocase TatA/TatE family subunit [Aliarcobacter sp.]|jgi:sec-independent protein translocase protein TatA|nr:twin-arginine translocase TatA/TatE family subunit [Aliarcobacter sp.]